MRLLRRVAKLGRILVHGEHRAALRHGIAASVELEPVPFGSGLRTVLDVGANRGQFAAFALRRFPATTIHSFEPLAGPADRLARAADTLAPGRIHVHRFALGATNGTATMHVASEDDSSSLLPLGPLQRELGSVEVGRVSVEMRRLDSAIRPADLVPRTLLKIDVQGAELEVLRGAEGVLAEVDEILVECSFVAFYEGQPLAGAVVAYLDAHGFRLRHTLPSITAGGAVRQADLLFVRAPEADAPAGSAR